MFSLAILIFVASSSSIGGPLPPQQKAHAGPQPPSAQDFKVEKQQTTITQLKSTVAQQQQEIEALTASLKEQAAQIRKVSDRLEVSKAAPQLVLNNQ